MKHQRMSRLLALTLAVVLGLGLVNVAGCAKPEGSGEGGGATKTIKVGVHTSLTGGLADYGFAASEGLKLAAKDFTDFEVDGTKYKIELVIKDDKGEPAEAPVVAQQLVDEGVIAVIGCLTSGNTNASMPIYKAAGIPVISGSATAPDLTELGFENFFRTCLRDDLQGKALGEWAVALGAKKAAVMDDRGDYSVALGNEVEAALKAGGVQTLRQEGQEGDVDFSAQVANIKAFAPDAVIYTGYHREAGLLFKQLVEAGVKTQFMGGDGIKSNELGAEAGGSQNVEGALCTFGGFAQENMPGYAEFSKRFKEATGKEAGPYAENNYDALGALVEAIKAAGSTDGAAIIAKLHEIEYKGIQGTLTFDKNGDVSVPGGGGTDLIPHFEYKSGIWTFMK